jgi:hypothetical protein
MRWAFFLLLFVNAAFLIWHQLHQPSSEPVVVTATKSPGGNKSIRLLHEVENGTISPAEVFEPANGAAQRAREAARSLADDSSRAGSSVPRADSTRRGEELRTTPVIESPPPLTELEKKVLAAEARQAERIEANLAARKNEERAAREHPRPPAEPEAIACYTVGPFNTAGKAESVLVKLSSLGLRTALRDQEVRSAQQWWVIDATKDERAAQKRLDELRKKKVTDASIISSGEYENMISLGKFDSEAQANKRVNALLKLGFRPVVEKHFDSAMQYWVDYDETTRRGVSAAQVKDAISGMEGAEKQKRACK